MACRYDNGEDYSLAVHRIKAANAMTLHFDAPKDFKLSKYVKKGRFNYGDGEKVEVNFTLKKSAGIHLAETPLSKDQTITDLDDGYIAIKATVVDSLLLDNFVNSFGEVVRSYDKTYLESE
ncbi:hypothetical protein A3735_27540 [Oleiphilus sp. HI0061]|nr:WYL domain-containing protein [Oleiphilus sp. HI0061]KZY62027.1 hypothetical protein A3735_27540 [Oleiphilus sp. HI0061]